MQPRDKLGFLTSPYPPASRSPCKYDPITNSGSLSALPCWLFEAPLWFSKSLWSQELPSATAGFSFPPEGALTTNPPGLQ